MESERNFIMQKRVDWSLLNQGMTIPVSVCALLQSWNKDILTHGHKIGIKVVIDGLSYDAELINQNFEKEKWSTHKDVIQIRYGVNSPLAKKLRQVFYRSYDYLYNQKLLLGKSKRPIPLPENLHEFIRLYLVDSLNMIYMECCFNEDYNKLAMTLSAIPEEIYESADDKFFMADKSASIVEKQLLVKYRKMDRSIIRMLKEYYDYKDEISGEKIGSEFGDSVVEAHHIEYFTDSQNNDSTNIIIISPNYHRIIHKNNPNFNRKKFQFEFQNGEILPLKLFDHLKT